MPPERVPSTVPGLIHIRGAWHPEMQDLLLRAVDGHPWESSLKRRTQQYGYKYDYTSKKVDASHYLGPLPPWLDSVGRAVCEIAGLHLTWAQIIVNEYLRGQGIGEHSDSSAFGPIVGSLSLGAPTFLRFRPYYRAPDEVQVEVQPGDLLVLQGLSRRPWTHEIKGVDVKSRRVSLTFRTL